MAHQEPGVLLALTQLAQKLHIDPTLMISVLGIIAVTLLKQLTRNFTKILLACIGYQEIKSVQDSSSEELQNYASVFTFITPDQYISLAREFPSLTPAQVSTLIHRLEPRDRVDFETTQKALQNIDPGTLARYRSETMQAREINNLKKTLVNVAYWATVASIFFYIYLQLAPFVQQFSKGMHHLPQQTRQIQHYFHQK
jgi:hypothetical protein